MKEKKKKRKKRWGSDEAVNEIEGKRRKKTEQNVLAFKLDGSFFLY